MSDKAWPLIVEQFPGYLVKRDPTQMPPGALILGSQNVVINDDDRIANRSGSELFGASSTATTPIKSTFNFIKRDGTELPLRTYDDELEYYHPTTEAWESLNDGYTLALKFAFAEHNINTDAVDYVYFCNAIEPYSRWGGAVTILDGALSGGETIVTVDSVLTPIVLFKGLASSVTTTTLTFGSGGWATDLWNDRYIHILDGAQAGSISKITATTATSITFGTIAGLSGTPLFEIREFAFDENNKTIRIGTSDVTWTSTDNINTFNGCANVPAALDDAAVAQAIEELPAATNPRGNVFLVVNTRMFVANVTANEQAVYHSAVADASDFTFTPIRAADEGGIIDFPENGSGVNGIASQEDVNYIFKRDLIYTLSFTQDGNDLPIVKSLLNSPGGGAIAPGAVFKADGEVFYVSKEGGIKSVKRPEVTDFARPEQLSDRIVSLVRTLDFSETACIFFNRKAYISGKQEGSAANDIVLVFNFDKRAWEAPIIGWNVNSWMIYDDKLYFGSSINPEVYQAETDTFDDNDAQYECIARFAFTHMGSPQLQKKFDIIYLEGFIGETTELSIRVLYNFDGGQETREGTFSGTEDDYIISSVAQNALATSELGLDPLAGIVEVVSTNDLPKFRMFLTTPLQPVYEVSLEISSDATGAQWEILRFGYNATRVDIIPKKLKKQLA